MPVTLPCIERFLLDHEGKLQPCKFMARSSLVLHALVGSEVGSDG